jgi:hypothetical protein
MSIGLPICDIGMERRDREEISHCDIRLRGCANGETLPIVQKATEASLGVAQTG